MRDALFNFGAIDSIGSTVAYSANDVDFGIAEVDLGNLSDAVLVITATAACAGVTVSLCSGSTTAPTTSIRDYSIGTLAAGDRVIKELPLTCSRYLRVGAKGTSGSITAHIEMGGKEA